MKVRVKTFLSIIKIVLGCAVFGLGFNLFLAPNGLNAGGISGISMLIVHLTGFGTIGILTAVMNLPLFAIGGLKIGKKFLFGSFLGMLFSAAAIDVLATVPVPQTEPLVGCLYGGRQITVPDSLPQMIYRGVLQKPFEEVPVEVPVPHNIEQGFLRIASPIFQFV